MMTIIKFKTSKLAYKNGFTRDTPGYSKISLRAGYYTKRGELNGDVTAYIREYIKRSSDEKPRLKHELYPAPTQSVLQKWLREEHNISVIVDFKLKKHPVLQYSPKTYDVKNYHIHGGELYETYEEALEKGLQKGLKLIKAVKPKREFKKGKYLKILGWKRDDTSDGEISKYYYFNHPVNGEYNLLASYEDYIFGDVEGELKFEEKELTKSLIDSLHTDFIDKGIKSQIL
jgi:hypothetical protein